MFLKIDSQLLFKIYPQRLLKIDPQLLLKKCFTTVAQNSPTNVNQN